MELDFYYCPYCGNKAKLQVSKTAQGSFWKCDWKPCGQVTETTWANKLKGYPIYINRLMQKGVKKAI